jgi:hypothetical protein
LVERRIRQLRRVYEQAGDVGVLLDLLQAENRAYVRQMEVRRQGSDVSQELRREGEWVYLHVPSAACQRRADYLRSLCEGVLGRPVDVEPVSGGEAHGGCRIALRLPAGWEAGTVERP